MTRTLNPNRLIAAALVAAGLAVACTDSTTPTEPTTSTPVPVTTTAAPPTTTTTTPTTPTTPTSDPTTCATGDGVNDACSCDADAHAYCAGFYAADWQSYARANGYTTASWKYGLIDCLGKQPVAAACTVSLARRETLNEQMMDACQSYCRGTTPQPGAEPCVDHLKSVYGSLNSMCRTALDAHEAAKSIEERGALPGQ